MKGGGSTHRAPTRDGPWTRLRGVLRRPLFKFAALVAAFVGGSSWLFWFFEHDHPEQTLQTPVDLFYWWVISCTTVGYGDIAPKTQAGKVVVIFTVLAGVSVVGSVVARFGTAFVQRRLQELRGFGRMDNLSGHTLVLGWNSDLAGILQSLVSHGGTQPSRIVLVNSQGADKVGALQSRKELAGLQLVSGDFTVASDLERAGATRAARVLVLADDGDSSPDSRTLLAVMTLRQLNKEAHVCAEVREERFVRYVREAGADEMIDPTSFRRAMAAQILASPGMGNVFYDLLRFERGATFDFEDIPHGLAGKTFGDLRKLYAERENTLLVGLLENVGNPLQVKREALREAQKTPDVSQLVTQLREAKRVKPHHPMLCPPGDHVLKPRTLAVVLHRAAGAGGRE